MVTKIKKPLYPHPAAAAAEAVEPVSAAAETGPAPLSWLSVEVAMAALVAVISLGLRLWQPGLYPLSNVEAAQSLAAFSLYYGNTPPADVYSPLLLTLNSLSFMLFGPTDGVARLAPALLGSGLVLLPLTLRRYLGRRGSLLAAALLALSPTALYASRTLNAEIGVAAGSLALIAGYFNWVESQGQRRWLWLMAAGLAVLLSAGPMAISVVVVFAAIVALRRRAFTALTAWGNWLNAPESGATLLRQAGLIFAAGLVLLATAGLTNLNGLARLSGYITDWLGRFGLQAAPNAGFNAVFLLTVYEPLLVLAGLVGLAYVLLRRDLFGAVLAGWLVGLLALDVVMGGRPTAAVILPLTPLALLAAMTLEKLWHDVAAAGAWANEGVLLAAGLVMAGFAYIGLTGWLVRACAPTDTVCHYGWLQPVAAAVLFLVIVAFFGYLNNAGVALRGAALTVTTLGLIITVNVGWRLNFGPLMHLPFQPLAGLPPATGLVTLVDTLKEQSVMRVGDENLLDVAFSAPAPPALQWQLRHFKNLTQGNAVNPATPPSAIITPAPHTGGLDLPQPYAGQDFALDALWSPVNLPPKDFVKWLVYRAVPTPPPGNKVILWLRMEQN